VSIPPCYCYVASIFILYVCLFVRMRCNLGNCERSENLFSSYNPGLGPRFLIITKYGITVADRNSQHCSQYNNCLITKTYDM